jgi:hypothetical protein
LFKFGIAKKIRHKLIIEWKTFSVNILSCYIDKFTAGSDLLQKAAPCKLHFMTRGILIAGNESALTGAVEAETAGRVERYALALIPDRFSGEDPGIQARREAPPAKTASGAPVARVSDGSAEVSSETPRILLDWNPGSPVSARALVLAAENRLGRIDEAILVCDPPSVRRAAVDLGFTDVEILANDHIKGWFFLVKELAAIFKTRGEGTLALVFPEGIPAAAPRRGETGKKDTESDLLGPAALAAFRSLAGGLLTAAFDEPYLTLGFSGASAGDEAGFAAFILKNIQEGSRRNTGKLHKYGKLGFFR